MAYEFNVLALVKGPEQFVFVYDDPSRDDLITTLRDLAGDPKSALTWFDALVLTKKAREQAIETSAMTADFGEDDWSVNSNDE